MSGYQTHNYWTKLVNADETEIIFLHRAISANTSVVIEYDRSVDAFTVMTATVVPARDEGLSYVSDEDNEKTFYGRQSFEEIIKHVDVTYNMKLAGDELASISP